MEATSERLEDVWEAILAYLSAEKIELDDLELVGRGRAQTLRVLVDGEGLDLDRIAEVSRGLSRLLDSMDIPALEGPYQLEVSSPGLERKLTRARHYEKSIGREVVVKTASGQRRGVIVAAGPDHFTIAEESSQTVIPFTEVVSARTVFTVPKPPKPGHRSN
jgi:ribosome maturation factor RimP